VTRENNYAEEPTTAMKLLLYSKRDTLEKKQRKIELAVYGKRDTTGKF
jgi:hypothetical protein